MKLKPDKGSYGYIRDYKKYHGIISALWFVLVAVIYVAGLLVYKTNKNYMTLAAILLVLPAVKAWIASIVMLPYHTQERQLYDKTCAFMRDKSAKVYSDLVITKYEGSMMLSIVVNYNDNFYVYVPKQKKTTADIRSYLNEMLAEAGLTTKSQVCDDSDKFLKMIEKLSEGPNLTSKKTKALEQKLFSTAI